MKKVFVLTLVMVFLSGICFAAKDVTFEWDHNTETDLAGYRLYQSQTSGQYPRGDGAGFVAEIPAGTNTHTLTLQTEGIYYWVLTAYDTENNESNFSNINISQIRLDNFSTMNYEEVIRTGYNELYLYNFNSLYNLFALTSDSPAINRGEKLPDHWPDIVEITDQFIDIGAHEHESKRDPLSPPNNLRIFK